MPWPAAATSRCGDLIDGKKAERIGLVSAAVPAERLDAEVTRLPDRTKGVPKNQLWMQKTAINAAFDNIGLRTVQTLATVFDGITWHLPEGMWFKEHAERHGFHEAVRSRDCGRRFPAASRRGTLRGWSERRRPCRHLLCDRTPP
jgi:enoyl-CoA hydratase